MTQRVIIIILVLIILALTLVTCRVANISIAENNTETLSLPQPMITSSPSPSPSTPEPMSAPEEDLLTTPIIQATTKGLIIAIDAGHQSIANHSTEPIGPGSSTQKAKVAAGTRGISTKVPEYQLNLDISLQLKDELIERGYTVVMIREANDVNISNSERAKIAEEESADVFIRVHANGSENRNIHGILMITTSRNNPFIPHLYDQNMALSEAILAEMVEATGAYNRGVIIMDDMTGSNWATMPVTIIEMGFMTNADEDELMQTEEYQQKLVTGIANGIDNYFG